jgi:hypothetical protein
LPDVLAPRSLPAKPEIVASYLHEILGKGKSYASLKIVVAAIARAHLLKGYADPCDDELPQAILRAAMEMDKADREKTARRPKRKASNGHALSLAPSSP